MKIDKKAFVQALRRAIEVNKKAPSFSKNILLRVADGVLIIEATDLEIRYVARIPYKGSESGGPVLGDARKILKNARARKGREIECVLSSTGSVSDGFPKAFSVPSMTPIKISGRGVRLFERVAPSMDPERGVLLEWHGKTLRAVSTNGHSVTVQDVQAEGKGQSVVVPIRAIELAMKFFEKSADLEIATSDTGVLIRSGAETLTARAFEKPFPPYAEVIPDKSLASASAMLSRDHFFEGVVAVAGFTERGYVKIELEDIVSVSEKTSLGRARCDVSATIEGTGLVQVDGNSLQGALEALDETTITIEIHDLLVVRAEGFVHVLMRVRS